MATAAFGPARSQGERSTLGLLKATRLLILVLSALWLLACVIATEVQREALTTVGKQTAPSIIAAQHIQSAMAGMDADAAQELLRAPGYSPGNLQAYESRRSEAARALIAAAENITFGNAERVPILTLQVSLGTYERLIQKARDLHQHDDPAAVATYREAAGVMDNVLMPAAAALDKANNDVLEESYRAGLLRCSATRIFVLLLALGLFVALAGTQGMLSRRMHRTFNPLLVFATLVLLVSAVLTSRALSRSQEALRIAKADAFTSVHILWQARAAAYAANAAQSRYLLDPAHAAEYQASFTQDARALANIPDGLDVAQMEAALRERRRIDGFSGYLADDFKNTHFRGEREAALDAFAAWEDYLGLDTQVRQLERSGHHDAAVVLSTGSGPRQSGRAVRLVDDDLWNTLAIDQSAFYGALGQGYALLRNLEIEVGAGAALVALMVLAGFAPRLREYQ